MPQRGPAYILSQAKSGLSRSIPMSGAGFAKALQLTCPCHGARHCMTFGVVTWYIVWWFSRKSSHGHLAVRRNISRHG
jgi:hypothetical protein